jgi:D-xylono/L-arabinono-1,4-lactonase
MQPELIADYACVCGEGPLWHAAEQRLYWADIANGRLFRYTPATGQHEKVYEGEGFGGFTVQADGKLLLFMQHGAVRTWHEGQMTTIIAEIPEERDTTFNDVAADPRGRVFCGTLPTKERLGRLYRLDPDGTLTKLLEGIGCSNGIGFSLDHKLMYYTDSTKYEIYVFDYDEASGAISNQRVLARNPESEGLPDGLTVDAEGYIWSARWDGSCLVRWSPDGSAERRVAFPAKKVSSVMFGGPDLSDIYATTAGGDLKEQDGPLAGGLFRIKLGIRGLPEFLSRIKL